MHVRFGLTATFAAFLVTLLLLPSPGGPSQNAGIAVGQESPAADLQAFRKLHNDLRRRMDDDIQEAAQYLESQIAASPDSADLNVLRHSLATQFADQENFKDANQQFAKLLDFQIKHVAESENQFGIWMTIQSIQEIARESGSSAELKTSVTRGLEALQGSGPEHRLQRLVPLSQLVVLQAQLLAEDKQAEQAKALIDRQLADFGEVNGSPQASEETMQAHVRMLRSLTSPSVSNDTWRDDYVSKLDEIVSIAIDRYPKSEALQNDFADTQFLMITQWRQDDPEANKLRMEAVAKKLDPLAVSNRSVRATLRRINVYQERIAAAKPVATLVGKPAPAWEIDAWVQAGGTTQDSLKGKVVLVDFWAMWCGPCIATFPHLRQWRDEFADKGFEIVGVTQYYNFEWDDANERAARSDDDVSPEDERETLARFLEHHQLTHPVIVTPKESEMQSEYGVRGIPHVVLIDREGVVQLVKTGAGEATANEIHAKIKELLATE